MDPFEIAETLQRQRRYLRRTLALMLLGFAALGGGLYWQSRLLASDVADILRPEVVFKGGHFQPVRGSDGHLGWQYVGT
jgi:hypothetical protein